MNNRRTGAWIVMVLFALLGLWQFSQGIRSVDALGLFARGALAGAAIAGLLMTRMKGG